jgi:hypothetical protein
MKITAISVVVNYSDFFKHCLSNKDVFDEWVIVTDTKDIDTKNLCDENGLTCLQTNVFYEGGGKFRKYAGINEALKHVEEDSWVVFIDADIILSPFARRTLEKIPLNPDRIYGIDRLNCKGFEKFIEFQKGKGVLLDNWLLHSGGLEWGARIIHIYGEEGENGLFTGYKPLGFFQLCHKSKITTYPEGSIDASHGDLAFAKLWDRKDRVLIPEILGIHIETGEYKSMNWQGRRSKIFDYKQNTPCWRIILDKIQIWWRQFCQPNYYNKVCCLCKLFK